VDAPLVYFSADYDGLELRTFSQVAIHMFGFSDMGKALNEGQDVHLRVGASLLKTTYDDAKARRKAGEKAVDLSRQSGKIGNFGYLGGMGHKKFRLSARKQYGVLMTDEEALDIKHAIYDTWSEVRPYHQEASMRAKSGDDWLESPGTGFIRGGLQYTTFCNHPFQHLAAAAATNALYLVSKHCYTRQPCAKCDGAANGCERCRACHGPGISPMFGARVVNFVHDEIIGECCEPWGHEVASELADLMVRGASEYLPDVPATCEGQLMRFWSKDAEPLVFGGRIQAWDYRWHVAKMAKKWIDPSNWFPRK
jgi:hypothetical protein